MTKSGTIQSFTYRNARFRCRGSDDRIRRYHDIKWAFGKPENVVVYKRMILCNIQQLPETAETDSKFNGALPIYRTFGIIECNEWQKLSSYKFFAKIITISKWTSCFLHCCILILLYILTVFYVTWAYWDC